MPVFNGIFVKPIDFVGTIAQFFGIASGDLEYLILHAPINAMSKIKPVANPDEDPDRAQPVSVYGRTQWWWKGHPSYTEVPAGLRIGNYTTTDKCAWFTCCGVKYLGFLSKIDVLRALDPIYNRYTDGDNSPLKDNFTYVPPAGGMFVEPYRALDFDQYDHDAEYNVIPDYGTESGTVRVDVNNPAVSKVACGIMSQAVLDTQASELSFNDLFDGIGSAKGFTVVTGKLLGQSFAVVNLSITNTRNDDYFKEVAINLNDSQAYGSTIIAIYCAYITVGSDTYYIPLMQSTGDHPNTTISYAPRRKIYASWYVDNATPWYPISFSQKQNYGSSFAWAPVAYMSSFQTSGLMNRWYLKIAMPKKTASYAFGNNAFKIEFTGQFMNSRGQLVLAYYALTSSDTRFVLKNNEVTDNYDWGTTETVAIAPGSGTQDCYLAIYDVFANRGGVETVYGGIIWRIRLFFLNGQQDFSPIPDVEYGSLDSSHLNIEVQAIQ